MTKNSLVIYDKKELERVCQSIAITNKLLSKKTDLKVLIVYYDNILRNLICYTLNSRGGYEIDDVEISETEYETALTKSKQKKYDFILITTMLNALSLTSKLREDINYKNALIYILSADRNFCSKEPKEYNVTGFIMKDDFFIDELIDLVEQIKKKFKNT